MLDDSLEATQCATTAGVSRKLNFLSSAAEGGAVSNISSESDSQPAAIEYGIPTATKSRALLSLRLAEHAITLDTPAQSVALSATNIDERVTPIPNASLFEPTIPMRRRTFPTRCISQDRVKNDTSLD